MYARKSEFSRPLRKEPGDHHRSEGRENRLGDRGEELKFLARLRRPWRDALLIEPVAHGPLIMLCRRDRFEPSELRFIERRRRAQ